MARTPCPRREGARRARAGPCAPRLLQRLHGEKEAVIGVCFDRDVVGLRRTQRGGDDGLGAHHLLRRGGGFRGRNILRERDNRKKRGETGEKDGVGFPFHDKKGAGFRFMIKKAQVSVSCQRDLLLSFNLSENGLRNKTISMSILVFRREANSIFCRHCLFSVVEPFFDFHTTFLFSAVEQLVRFCFSSFYDKENLYLRSLRVWGIL